MHWNWWVLYTLSIGAGSRQGCCVSEWFWLVDLDRGEDSQFVAASDYRHGPSILEKSSESWEGFIAEVHWWALLSKAVSFLSSKNLTA